MKTKRGTGRTTSRILDAISRAIQSPSTAIRFVDHSQPKELPVSYTSSYIATKTVAIKIPFSVIN